MEHNIDTQALKKKFKELRISPGLFNWGDNVVKCTEIWYDDATNRMCADCGVSVPIKEPLNIAGILIDLEALVISHYKNQNIVLETSYE